MFSPTEDQSKEFLGYVREMNEELGCPVPLIRESLSELAWANGSRIKAKADSPRGSRGFTPNMIVVDEGAQVSDELYLSIKPMMVLGQAEMIILSTPFGKSGWFFDIWDDDRKLRQWQPFKVTAYECPRIDSAILEEHRLTMPPRWFNQEFLCHRPTSLVRLWNGEMKQVSQLITGDVLPCIDRETDQMIPCNVVAVRDTGETEMCETITEAGDKFTASADHPVQTPAGKMPLRFATELHYVATEPCLQTEESALARLVAFNTGDGTITVRANGMPQAAFYSLHRRDLEGVAADLALAGVAIAPKIGLKKSKPGLDDTWQIQCSGTKAQKLIDAGCPTGKKVEKEFEVPGWVFNGSLAIQREYVAALWGAEGNCLKPVGSGIAPTNLVLSMHKRRGVSGRRFFEQLCEMMNRLGCPTSLRVSDVRNDRTLYLIQVIGGVDGYLKFLKHVGYRYSSYKTKAGLEWRCYLLAKRSAASERVAKVKRLVAAGLNYREVGRRLGCSKDVAYFLNRDVVRGSRINGFMPFEEWASARRSESGLYLQVASSAILPPERVVNIEVDSADHSYLMADGLDNYNCEFNDAVDAVFGREVIDRAARLDDAYLPLEL